MSGWRKFGVVLYCSTTLAATVAVGFALFIGAAPSNINLFDKNRDVRNWLFIAAAAFLTYITFSAFIMFCVLVSKSTKKLHSKGVNTNSITDNLQQKSKTADDSNPLLQHYNIITSSSVESTTNSQQSDGKGIIQDTKEATYYVNEEVDIINKSVDCLRSSYFDSTPLSSLQVDDLSPGPTYDQHAKLRKETDKRQEQDYAKGMVVPYCITMDMCNF